MKWTYRQAMWFLIGSTAATLILSLSLFFVWHEWRMHQIRDARTNITAIVQTGPEKEALKTACLAELLDLSADKPISLYAFDIKEAEKKLRSCPLISEAKIERVPPSTLYVDYSVRKMAAWLADYQNTAIDKEGYIFPVQPFYSPKNLPEIYLGLPAFGAPADGRGRAGGAWQTPVQNRHFSLAIDILRALDEAPWREGMRLKRIDVSNAFEGSAGQREIVIFTEEELIWREKEAEIVCSFPKILRLPVKDYSQQLGNFLILRRAMIEDYKRQLSQMHLTGPTRFAPRIVDLRIPEVAFVQNSG